MKVLVAVKPVPDPTAYLPLGEDGRFNLTGVRWVVNPWDEIALDRAVSGKSSGAVTEIVAVTVGAGEREDVLRAALARGADRAVLVTVGNEAARPETVAARLAGIVEQEKPDLVLFGATGADSDDGQTGQRVAGLLGWPYVTRAVGIGWEPGNVTAVRDTDAGRETVRVAGSAVITCDLGTETARPLPLPAILKAKSKPLERVEAPPLRVPPGSATVGYLPVPRRAECRMVESLDELLAALASRRGGGGANDERKAFDLPSEILVGVECEADALAYLSGRNCWPLVRDVLETWAEGDHRFYRRAAHAGKYQETVAVPTGRSHAVTVSGESRRTAEQRQRVADALAGLALPEPEVVSREPVASGRPDLMTARTVVAGGRAFRDAETFERLVGRLADALGGAAAASGGASNTGIAPAGLVVGQSGKTVAPDLYIALGISGADQHVAGFRDARTVVAINADADAPIFKHADIGMVGDVLALVPEWIARVRP